MGKKLEITETAQENITILWTGVTFGIVHRKKDSGRIGLVNLTIDEAKKLVDFIIPILKEG